MTARILVVDDAHVDRHLIRALLANHSDWTVELAENGRDALQKVHSCPPDVVVTDLVMPEMDGLGLLRVIRRDHPDLPVILLTAFGNESIAVEALQSGAASYVPKAFQAERLAGAIERVLEHAAADRWRGRLDRCVLEYQWRIALENDPILIRALGDQVQRKMASIQFANAGERIRVSEALEEALLNAMYHGNLEISERELAEARADLSGQKLERLVESRLDQPQCRGRKIFVIIHISSTEARFVIRDEGKGFNVRSLINGNPTQSFENGKRRGLTLIQSLMDEVTFNDAGNELTMSKGRPGTRAYSSCCTHE